MQVIPSPIWAQHFFIFSLFFHVVSMQSDLGIELFFYKAVELHYWTEFKRLVVWGLRIYVIKTSRERRSSKLDSLHRHGYCCWTLDEVHLYFFPCMGGYETFVLLLLLSFWKVLFPPDKLTCFSKRLWYFLFVHLLCTSSLLHFNPWKLINKAFHVTALRGFDPDLWNIKERKPWMLSLMQYWCCHVYSSTHFPLNLIKLTRQTRRALVSIPFFFPFQRPSCILEDFVVFLLNHAEAIKHLYFYMSGHNSDMPSHHYLLLIGRWTCALPNKLDIMVQFYCKSEAGREMYSFALILALTSLTILAHISIYISINIFIGWVQNQ